ncbi:MAG: hypothetical protein M9949_04965 [Candidatus Kapabacteria bacterium]|nr:hypothetical protein [Candidatus Kapabacteria bacterium]
MPIDYKESALIFQNGIKNGEFVVFNPLEIELMDVEPLFQPIYLNVAEFWNDLKSMVWSSNCRFFFVVTMDKIIICNVHDNEAFEANLSSRVFDVFLNVFGAKSNAD